MSTCVYEAELHTDIFNAESMAVALRAAADRLDKQKIIVDIDIAGLTVTVDFDSKAIYVID